MLGMLTGLLGGGGGGGGGFSSSSQARSGDARIGDSGSTVSARISTAGTSRGIVNNFGPLAGAGSGASVLSPMTLLLLGGAALVVWWFLRRRK